MKLNIFGLMTTNCSLYHFGFREMGKNFLKTINGGNKRQIIDNGNNLVEGYWGGDVSGGGGGKDTCVPLPHSILINESGPD